MCWGQSGAKWKCVPSSEARNTPSQPNDCNSRMQVQCGYYPTIRWKYRFFSEKLYDFKMLATCSEAGFRLPTANPWFSRRAIERVQNIQTMIPTPDQSVQGLCTCHLSQCAWPGYKFDNSQLSLTSHVVFVGFCFPFCKVEIRMLFIILPPNCVNEVNGVHESDLI